MASRPCDHCGYPIKDGVVFCPSCGAWRDYARGNAAKPAPRATVVRDVAYQMPPSHEAGRQEPEEGPVEEELGYEDWLAERERAGDDTSHDADETELPYVPPRRPAHAPRQQQYAPPNTYQSTACPRCGSPLGERGFCGVCGMAPSPGYAPAQAPRYPVYYQRRRKGWLSGPRRAALLVIATVVLTVAIILALFPQIITGDQTCKFTWTSQGKTYHLEVKIAGADYKYYRNYAIERHLSSYDQSLTLSAKFVTSQDPTVAWVANEIRSLTAGMSKTERATVALAFVQSIAYKSDSVSEGERDYFRFPVETLYDHCGDCEDSSFLLAALLEAMGYDAVVLFFIGHAAVGVDVDDPYGSSRFYKNGVPYYLCETTSPGWRIGERPSGLSSEYWVAQVS